MVQNQTVNLISSPGVNRAAPSFSSVTRGSVCVCLCAVGGFCSSADSKRGGLEEGVTIKMVNIMLPKRDGRRQEEKVGVSPKMLLFIQWVCSPAAVYWEFVYSSGVSCPFVFRLCIVGRYARTQANCQLPPQQIILCLVLFFNFCSLTSNHLVLQPTPVYFHWWHDLIQSSGIN